MELFTRRAFQRQECTVHLKSAYAIENKTKNAIQQHRGICTSAPSRVRADSHRFKTNMANERSIDTVLGQQSSW